MTTFGELRDRALRLIGNPAGEGIEPERIADAVAAAHDAILPWIPKLQQTTITGDGTSSAFNLPADFYMPEAVIIQATGEILPQAVFAPYKFFGPQVAEVNSWLLEPTGKISFSKPLNSLEVYDLYYAATWKKPNAFTLEGDLLEPPSYLDHAMSLYTAAQLVTPDALGIASIASYKTRVDSGTPEDNPMQKAITFLMNLFNQEMNRHPKHQRAQT